MYNFPPTFNYVTQSALLLNFFNTLEVSSIHFYYSSAAGENKAIVIATVVTRHGPFIVNNSAHGFDYHINFFRVPTVVGV